MDDDAIIGSGDAVAETVGTTKRSRTTVDYRAVARGPKIPHSKDFYFFASKGKQPKSATAAPSDGDVPETKKGKRDVAKAVLLADKSPGKSGKKKRGDDGGHPIEKVARTKAIASASKAADKATPHEEATKPALWRTRKKDHKWIGRRGARVFSGRVVEGVVVGWLPGEPNELDGVDPALWRFEHDDGDSEELDEHEAKAAFDALAVIAARPPPRTREENWSEFQGLAPSASASFQVGATVLAWDENKASGVTVSNAYPAVVLAVRTCAGSDESKASASANAEAGATGSAMEYRLHFNGFNKRYDRWQGAALMVALDARAQAAVSRLHPYGVNKAAPPPLPASSLIKRFLPEGSSTVEVVSCAYAEIDVTFSGFPPTQQAAEYGSNPSKHITHLGLCHLKVPRLDFNKFVRFLTFRMPGHSPGCGSCGDRAEACGDRRVVL